MTDKARILVLDDDQQFLKLCTIRLQAAGYEVLAAFSWKEVHNLLEQKPQLALLDINLNAMEGDSLARIMKVSNPDIKVVLFSSEDEEVIAAKAKAAHCDGWLSKSSGFQEMLDTIQTHLG